LLQPVLCLPACAVAFEPEYIIKSKENIRDDLAQN